MNKKGVIKIFLLIALIVIMLVATLFFISYFMNKGKIACPITPDKESIIRMPLQGILAGGKQTGAETHTFNNGDKVSVCCADVQSGPNPERKFKDCISYDNQGKQNYQVVWENKNDNLVLIKESFTDQGSICVYNFDNNGNVAGRTCENLNEIQKVKEPSSVSDCDSVTDPLNKDICYYNLYVTQNKVQSLDDCNKITTEQKIGLKEACYSKVAELTGDKNICDSIKTDYAQDVCYLDVACKTGDLAICKKFEQDKGVYYSSTTLCYRCAAKIKNDKSLCDSIKDTNVQEECYKQFSS